MTSWGRLRKWVRGGWAGAKSALLSVVAVVGVVAANGIDEDSDGEPRQDEPG
jgi:hypothetical protein